jgi:hypothetical protein
MGKQNGTYSTGRGVYYASGFRAWQFWFGLENIVCFVPFRFAWHEVLLTILGKPAWEGGAFDAFFFFCCVQPMFSPDIFGWVAGWVFYHSSYSCQVMFTLHGEQAVAVWIDTTTFLCHVIYTFICNLVVFLCHDLLTV